MSRALSWVILTTAVIGLLALCLLLFIPMLLESSFLRPQMERWASGAVGRPVSIQGPVEVSFLPAIRLRLSGLLVGASEGSPQKESINAGSLQLESTWGHILRKGLRPQLISIHNLHLVLERDAAKVLGWMETTGKSKKREGSNGLKADRTPPPRLRIPILGWLPDVGLEISEADLLLADFPAHRPLRVTGISLSIGEPSADETRPLRARGNVQAHPFLVEGTLKAPSETEAAGNLLLIELAGQLGGKLRGSLKGQIRSLERGPESHLQVRVEPFPLQPLLAAVGHDPKESLLASWNQVSFRGEVILSQSSFEVKQAEFRLDDFLVNFSAAVGKNTQQELVLNLETEELDLNRFSQSKAHSKPRRKTLGSQGSEPKEPPKASAEPKFPDLPLFALAGSAKIHKVMLKAQPFNDLEVSYKLGEGVLLLEGIRVKLEGGELWGSGSLDFSASQPHLHFYLNTRDVQVGPVLQRLARTVFLEGKMESRWDLEGPWEGDLDQAALSWTGQADILLKDGSINGVDLAKVSRSLGLAGEKQKENKARVKTPFSSLEAHLGLEGGLLKVSKASMLSRDMRILAAGQADLLEKFLDFRLEPELGSHEEGSGSASLVVPFWVDGSFSHPKFHPDLSGIRKKGEGKLHLSLPSAKDLKEVFRNLLKGREKQ